MEELVVVVLFCELSVAGFLFVSWVFKRYREEYVVAKRKRSGNTSVATLDSQSFNEKELAPFLQQGTTAPFDSHTVFLPPEWLDWYEELSNNVESVKDQLAQLESLQQNHLLPVGDFQTTYFILNNEGF